LVDVRSQLLIASEPMSQPHAFVAPDIEKRLGINKSKADAALSFISSQIQTKLKGEGATDQYRFILEKLRSQRPEDAALLPTIYLGLARNASAISGDRKNELVSFGVTFASNVIGFST